MMIRRHRRWIPYLLLAFLILNACNLPSMLPATPAPPDTNAIHTQAAQTVAANLTQIAQGFQATPTSLVIVDDPDPIPPASPAAPTNTPLPPPSATPQATATSQPTGTPAASPTPRPCNRAEFVRDVTVPDGTPFSPGAYFTKTWRLKNAGSCTWTRAYSVVYVSGDGMGGDTTPLGETVEPGETVDISVNFIAPEKPGTYTGYWMLRDDSGRFGLGAAGDKAFYVEIEVEEVEAGIAYSFVANYCAAEWETKAGDLPCPGEGDEPSGFVLRLAEPDLENRRENEPALWTNPQMVDDGWITGTYPPITVRAGDRFLADVGCLEGYTGCDVLFHINYRAGGGAVQTLGEWREVYDESVTRVDVDLTPLAGQSVQFSLTVLANGSSKDDAAFWLVPQIRR